MSRGARLSAEVAARRAAERRRLAEKREGEARRGRVHVRTDLLRPTNSYDTPELVRRGYYEDFPFICKDCGAREVWRATQQKWWCEVARGDVWAVAVRCRPCRRRERERKNKSRDKSQQSP